MKKCVLITGASSGLGKKTAIELSKEYDVVINGRNRQALNETKELCKNNCYIWEYDLSKLESIEVSLKHFIREHDLSIYAYVHCAGSMKMVPCKMIETNNIYQMFAINVQSAALITKVLATKKYNNQSLKSVVYISSNISNRGAKAFSLYGSSKAALNGLMRCLAVELAPKIRVNSVAPGAMVTEMTKDIFADEEKRIGMNNSYPLGIGTPDKVIPVIKLLVSEESEWVTGQEFVVDGGRTVNITE